MYGRMLVNTFEAIVVNYSVCVLTGILYVGPSEFWDSTDFSATWAHAAFGLGVVFLATFYLIARTTTQYSVTVSTIANKMSLAIPVLFSLFVFKTQLTPFSWLNYLGIFIAFAAILLSSIKPGQAVSLGKHRKFDFLLPISVFLFGGAIDTSINYINLRFLNGSGEASFPILIFGSAASLGILSLLAMRKFPSPKSLIWGALLGFVNFFSMFFLIKSLNHFDNDGAFVYPVMNIGIIVVSSVFSILMFGERLVVMNKIGLLLAILSIILISYQEILSL